MGSKKHSQKSGLRHSTPSIKGLNLHPLNQGGMGYQGNSYCHGASHEKQRFRTIFLSALVYGVQHKEQIQRDAAYMLTVGSFLLTVELLYSQLTILAFLLTAGAFLLTALAFLLTVGAFLLTVGKCV